MARQFIILVTLYLAFLSSSHAQSKEMLEKYVRNTLSYQSISLKSSGRNSRITIYQIEFNRCTMSYVILNTTGNKNERYTVRIFLPGIDRIAMTKDKQGCYSIGFRTKGKSILKEYPDGKLVHEQFQVIPLKAGNAEALQCFQKLKSICK